MLELSLAEASVRAGCPHACSKKYNLSTKMPKSCVMRRCKNYTSKFSKTQGITYHAFPANELRRHEWRKIVRKQRREDDWQPNDTSRICSAHFKDEDKYLSGKGLVLLKKTALPILEEPPLPLPRRESDSSIDIEEENISDSESENNPQITALEERIRETIIEKENLIKMNRNLGKRNKRLEEKAKRLTGILETLVKKEEATENSGHVREKSNYVAEESKDSDKKRLIEIEIDIKTEIKSEVESDSE